MQGKMRTGHDTKVLAHEAMNEKYLVLRTRMGSKGQGKATR